MDIDDVQEKAIKALRNVLVSKCFVKVQAQFPNDEIEIMKQSDPFMGIVKTELCERLSNHVIGQYGDRITEDKNIENTYYNMELVVMTKENMKSVVEGIIQWLPQDKIDQIKKGKVVL